MNRGKTLSVALDTEFLRTHGQVLTSSVAFVPFASAAHTESRLTTVFGEPVVVSLTPTEVLRRADVLPCGHCIRPLLEKNLVNGETLKTIQNRYTKAMNGNEVERGATAPVASLSNIVEDAAPLEMTRVGCASLPPIHSLCPYSIPNIRRTNESWLHALFTASTGSTKYQDAVKNLSYLRAYGKGRRHRPAFAFLMWHHPEILQGILQSSFSTPSEWCAWLVSCGNLVEKELYKVAECHHHASPSLSLPLSSSSSSSGGAAETVRGSVDAGVRGSFKECHSVEEMSYELSRCWSTLLHRRNGGSTKFYAYGDMDAKAIHNTLQLSCCSATRYTHCASRDEQTVSEPLTRQSGAETIIKASSLKPTRVSTELLVSPFQAQVVDITRHPLFAASGFRVSPKAIPSLVDALRKTAAINREASRLCALEDPHNPVWDAKALACISVSCGVG